MSISRLGFPSEATEELLRTMSHSFANINKIPKTYSATFSPKFTAGVSVPPRGTFRKYLTGTNCEIGPFVLQVFVSYFRELLLFNGAIYWTGVA